MGKFAAEAGQGVTLSIYVIEHYCSSVTLRQSVAHRVRWVRSTRRSRPMGYLGQVFTMPLPPALVLLFVRPGCWPVPVIAIVIRFLAAYPVSARVLKARLNWLLLSVEDLAGFCFWLVGF